ncbi:hypothetical protein BOX15_Mlig027838g1 [Macrostomum lignano]|uniref:Uncharacterized protein n=2 Tax=Macrostomum lignano TaxID=282301 RepID=A0A267EED1_9PLAT|nr:hypothetical protein BOX15_Mlig027838g1 [Macrostomum lignano]
MSDLQSSQPTSSTRRRATPPEPPTPLEAALSAGAADAELERLLDRRDEFGDDALTEEVERADTEADAAVLSLLTRPRLAERCWQPALFAAARCGRSGLLQRLRDADPAAWRRAVRSAGPDGRRVLHHAAAGGRVEAMLRLLRMLRMHHHQQQQPEAAMDDAGAEEEAPDEAEEAADGADEKRRAEKNLEQEAEALDTEEDFAELVYAVDCRGRTFLSELADLHPQALPELWPAELPGGLARVLELLDPPLQGLTDLPDRQAALETVAIAQEPVKRIVRSLSDLPDGERSDAARQLVRLSQSASSPKLLPALLRLGLVRPADCEQSFVLELVKAGWLTAASQLMRLQQTRLVETCVAVAAACGSARPLEQPRPRPAATPGGLAASAGRWLKSGEQAGDDASVDSGASNRERLRREAVTVALNALDAVYSGADGHWKARVHRHFFSGGGGAGALALADAAPELLAAPALAEYADRRWADGPDAAAGCLGFGSPAGGPPRFSPRTKHAARLLSLLLFQLLLTVQAAVGAGPTAARWSGLETVLVIWLLLQLVQEIASPAWDGGSALPPLPPLISALLLPVSACAVSGIGLIVWAVASGVPGPGVLLAAKILLCLSAALWSCRLLAALRPCRLAGLPVQQLLLVLRRDCWPMAASLLPGFTLGAAPLVSLLVAVTYAASSPAYSILVGVCLFLLLLLCWLLGARFCVTLAEAGDLAVGRQRRCRLAAAEALTPAGCLPAPLNIAYAVPQALLLGRRLRDRLTGQADADIEAAAALNRQDVYGNGCQGGGGGGDVGAASGQLLLGGGTGGGGGGSWGAAHKEDRQFQLFQAAAFRGKRHNFQRAWPPAS